MRRNAGRSITSPPSVEELSSFFQYQQSYKFKMRSTAIFFCFVVAMLIVHQSEATYKKPMFNGSIFGKRTSVEYDSTNKALTALCEIASETCQAWYQSLENK